MTSSDIISGAIPGIIAGCLLHLISSFVGPIMGPGWTDLLQGLSVFVGIIWVAIGIRRKQSANKQI